MNLGNQIKIDSPDDSTNFWAIVIQAAQSVDASLGLYNINSNSMFTKDRSISIINLLLLVLIVHSQPSPPIDHEPGIDPATHLGGGSQMMCAG